MAAVSKAQEALGHLTEALSELEDLRTEYEEWRDGLPENLQSSAVADKLEAVCELDIGGRTDDIEELLSECEGIDLPRGFGKD
jgi:hypothetical protein